MPRVQYDVALMRWRPPHSAALSAHLRRMNARLGAPQAITAAAHKLARIVYFTLKYGRTYVDKGAQWYEQQFRQRILKSLQSRALQLGCTLPPVPKPG